MEETDCGNVTTCLLYKDCIKCHEKYKPVNHPVFFSYLLTFRCFEDRYAVETKNIVGVVSGVIGLSVSVIFLIVIVISFKKYFPSK